ncbi:MAG: terminase small subunit [Oscillospiraceae bacterium]|nr:terminase small subunit [Oscillospiraceae bacterium]
MRKLTPKQQAWIDYYKSGHNATEAARLAGYQPGSRRGFSAIGYQNAKRLQGYIADREKVLEAPRIAGMNEINAFWTEVLRNPDASIRDRLEASKLRAKAAGGFIDRTEISASVAVVVDDLDG